MGVVHPDLGNGGHAVRREFGNNHKTESLFLSSPCVDKVNDEIVPKKIFVGLNDKHMLG